MECVKSHIEDLPDEVLVAILKISADMPAPSWDNGRAEPCPIAASCVSRRWHAITLGAPELWTNIRISHNPRSWAYANLFLERSSPYLLDISINLEHYVGKHNFDCKLRAQKWPLYWAEIPLEKVLAIVAPHIWRWRTLAFRASREQTCALVEFLQSSNGAASSIESFHLSLLGFYYDELPPLNELFGPGKLCSLRINGAVRDLHISLENTAIRKLDVDLSGYSDVFWKFIQTINPTSTLTTLVLHRFHPTPVKGFGSIEVPTVRSFAVSFEAPFYRYSSYWWPTGQTLGFETITDILLMPRLEHLEIIGGFTGDIAEDWSIRVPREWETPLFPCLGSLRLEDVGFSRRGLALVQSFSREITALELIYTTGNQQLLHTGSGRWPALRTLTVEAPYGACALLRPWLAPFITMRAAHGAPISELILPVLPRGHALALERCHIPHICWLCDGPSSALIDGVAAQGFYVDALDGHPVDFEYVDKPARDRDCRCGNFTRVRYESDDESDYDFDHYGVSRYQLWQYLHDWQESMHEENEIAEDCRVGDKLLSRAKGICREARKQKRLEFKASRGSRKTGAGRRVARLRVKDVRIDFSLR
ncbi:hypothetical protein B0H19DRAFT_1373329 [Mycena capillaripes]|nr:hypothetical protein B0H19DRAFT_1373329 [Mycena capillaripes]